MKENIVHIHSFSWKTACLYNHKLSEEKKIKKHLKNSKIDVKFDIYQTEITCNTDLC